MNFFTLRRRSVCIHDTVFYIFSFFNVIVCMQVWVTLTGIRFVLFKGIVLQDWGGLQKILLDRLDVYNFSASCFFLILLPFLYSYFKNGRLSGASFQHS